MQSETESCPVATPGLESRLEAAISHAAHLLPAQGPINVFVHHNTLHAFEEQGFHEAVAEATNTFGCHPYLLEEEYREELVETATTEAWAGALSVWFATSLSLAGFGLTLRSIESRFGRLSLTDYHGLYEHMPNLAVLFLLTG